MHELLLFAQVHSARHDQLLMILAGIAGMRPARVLERHLIWRPKRPLASKTIPIGATQGVQNQRIQALQGQVQGELFHLQLVGDISALQLDKAGPSAHDKGVDGDAMDTDGNNEPGPANGGLASPTWSLWFNDLPEVSGRRSVTSRMISRIDIIEGDVMGFMDALGYR